MKDLKITKLQFISNMTYLKRCHKKALKLAVIVMFIFTS